MESLSISALPKIFRFSSLYNILTFYGKLPRWMWLLKCLNSETYKIWEDNENAFMNWDVWYKLVEEYSSNLNLSIERMNFYGHIFIKSLEFRINAQTILPNLDNDVVMILENTNELIDIDMRMFDMKIIDINKFKDYFPSFMCPNIKNEVKIFPKESTVCGVSGLNGLIAGYHALNEFDKGAVAIKRLENNDIEVQSIISPLMPILLFESEQQLNDLIKRYWDCRIHNWWWLPESILISSFNITYFYLIDALWNVINKIKEIKVFYEDYWANKNDLEYMQKLLKNNEHIKVDHTEVYLEPETDLSRDDTLKLKAWSLIIINKKIVTPISFKRIEIKLGGSVIDFTEINKKEWIMLEIKSIYAKKFVYQYDSFLFKSITEECTKDVFNKLKSKEDSIWMLAKLEDIKSVELKSITHISTLWKYDNIKEIVIALKVGEFDYEELKEWLSSIPNHIIYTLRLSFNESVPDESEAIWKHIFEYKNLMLEWMDGSPITIIEIVDGFNQKNLNKNIFRTLIKDSEQIIDFKSLMGFLKKTVE